MQITTLLMHMYDLLYSAFGSQNWWPADTKVEMMVGAILTQNTSWANVEKAIQNLKNEDLLAVHALGEVPATMLAEYIRPAGYYNLKAKRLKNLITLINDEYDGDIEKLFSLDAYTARQALLSVNGIGMETADSIILYAAEIPIFIVDTYTHRILTRHNLIDIDAEYNELQAVFMDNLPHDVELYKEFHALIVKAGKEFCRKRPLCPDCPLENVNVGY